MKVWISHGVFDLVTPFFATERISRLMKLDPERRGKLTIKHFDGGHMYYTWRGLAPHVLRGHARLLPLSIAGARSD